MLAARVNALRCALMQLPQRRPGRFGIPPQGRLVAVSLGNHISFAEVFIAAASAPNCAVVLDPNLPLAQLGTILARLMPDLVVTDRRSVPLFHLAVSSGVKIICVDEAEGEAYSCARWLAAAGDKGAAPVITDLQGPFLIGFTSGSTSDPKAFIRARQSWAKSLERGRRVFGLGRKTHTLAPGPLAYGVSLYALAETLHAGATFRTLPAFDTGGVFSLLQKGIKRLVVVPAMISALSRDPAVQGAAFPGLAQLVAGGAKFERHHFTEADSLFPNAVVWQYYGASELGFVALDKAAANLADDRTGAVRVGRAFPSVTFTIRDGAGAELSAGAIGTVYVESDMIAGGYLWGDDGRSLRRTGHGATVGDTGFVDSRGRLFLVGRAGGMIVSGGNNIYLSEIELVLKKHPGIEEAVAAGLKDKRLGEKLVAVFSARPGRTLQRTDIAAFCAGFLPKYKIPKEFYAISRWPMTSSGKIARGRVENMIAAGSADLEVLNDA